MSSIWGGRDGIGADFDVSGSRTSSDALPGLSLMVRAATPSLGEAVSTPLFVDFLFLRKDTLRLRWTKSRREAAGKEDDRPPLLYASNSSESWDFHRKEFDQGLHYFLIGVMLLFVDFPYYGSETAPQNNTKQNYAYYARKIQ
jgi:hypothetical protein